jgi:hypothetical protein
VGNSGYNPWRPDGLLNPDDPVAWYKRLGFNIDEQKKESKVKWGIEVVGEATVETSQLLKNLEGRGVKWLSPRLTQ